MPLPNPGLRALRVELNGGLYTQALKARHWGEVIAEMARLSGSAISVEGGLKP